MPLYDVLLYQPEIPPNTGNVIRLCANTGARLHLIEPLGFDLDDRQLKRAGLDYHEYARMQVHPNLSSALAAIAPRRLFALSTRGQVRYDTPTFRTGDAFISVRKPAVCQTLCCIPSLNLNACIYRCNHKAAA